MPAGRPPLREAARAVGVVFGPSIVLDAAVASVVASLLRAKRRHRRPRQAIALAGELVAAYDGYPDHGSPRSEARYVACLGRSRLQTATR